VSEKVRDEDCERDHRERCFLKPCRDQPHPIAPFTEAEESLDTDAVIVVFADCFFIGLFLFIIFRTASQFRTRYADAVLLTECDVCPGTVDLVNEYAFWPSPGTFMISYECFLKLFRFVECFCCKKHTLPNYTAEERQFLNTIYLTLTFSIT